MEIPTLYFDIAIESERSIPPLPDTFPYSNPELGLIACSIALNAVSPGSLDGFPTIILLITTSIRSSLNETFAGAGFSELRDPVYVIMLHRL